MAKSSRYLLCGVVALGLATPCEAQPRAVRLPGYQAPMSLDSTAAIALMPVSAGAVFFATRQVFFELGIPAPIADSAKGYLINPRFIKMRSLARRPMSAYLHCGDGMTGPNADTFRVTMAVAAYMDSTGPSSSRLRVTVLAGAESVEGVAKSAVACGSSGVLEDRILQAVKFRARR